jgi:hypothetical protein
MRYFLDTEFVEQPNTIELISIGLVAEDGREFYAINQEANLNNADQWVKDNVLTSMPEYSPFRNDLKNGIIKLRMTIPKIKDDILFFVGRGIMYLRNVSL